MESEEAESLSTTTPAPPNIDLYIGREFSSYQEFEDLLDARKKLHGDRWKKHQHARTFEKYNLVIDNPDYHVPERLQYYDVSFRCIHEGDRPVKMQKSSFRLSCKAKMRLACNKGKTALVIKALVQDHNHPLLTPDYMHYPEDRRASAQSESDFTAMKELGETSGSSAMKELGETSGNSAMKELCETSGSAAQHPSGAGQFFTKKDMLQYQGTETATCSGCRTSYKTIMDLQSKVSSLESELSSQLSKVSSLESELSDMKKIFGGGRILLIQEKPK